MSAKVTWLEPYETVRGKFSKKSNLVQKITPVGKEQIAHRTGKRDLVNHPKTDTEKALNLANSAIFKAVAARRNDMSSTYTADLMAFNAQKADPNGKQTFQQYLYWDERKKYAQAHPGVF